MNYGPPKKPEQERINDKEEVYTITPTMLDEDDDGTQKRVDLSAIIPKFEDSSDSENAIELNSKENMLKGDGAVLIALVDGNGEARMTSTAGVPQQIDIEERKKELVKNKGKKNKKEKDKTNKKAAKKFQNRMSLASLIAIIFLGAFYYWYKNHPTDEDFVPLRVEVEVGGALPIRVSSYVKPGVGDIIDEHLYSIDLSNVVVEVPGEYTFEVTYTKLDRGLLKNSEGQKKEIKKTGTIAILDRTDPELEIRDVHIIEGNSYDASNFVENCRDHSGCNYAFQDTDTPNKYKTSGVYVVYIVATDGFGNTTTKRANLVIEAQGDVVTYLRKTDFDFNTGYETTESYELHFNSGVLISGTHQIIYYYQNEDKYNEASKTYSGEVNYVLDDSQKTITFKESVSTIGSNYSQLEHINDYLIREGFSKIE